MEICVEYGWFCIVFGVLWCLKWIQGSILGQEARGEWFWRVKDLLAEFFGPTGRLADPDWKLVGISGLAGGWPALVDA